MRELVECLRDWLAANRADGSAYTLLLALTTETLKRVGSNDAGQREFDAQQLAAAAERKEADDFEASKRWVDRAKLELFADVRAVAIDEHFRAAGHTNALRPKRRSPGGKHRAVWFLESYPLVNVSAESSANPETHLTPVSSADDTLFIQYEFTPPGQVRAAWYIRPLIGAGSFVTRSWRGLLWVSVLLIPLGYLLLSALLALLQLQIKRPLQTADLASLMAIPVLAWGVWTLFVRPMMWLLEDRIIPTSELWVAWAEQLGQLELVSDKGKKRRLQLVRYTAICPICAGSIELRYSQGPNRRRLVGCCTEAPHDHVYSFDRIRRAGRRIETKAEAV